MRKETTTWLLLCLVLGSLSVIYLSSAWDSAAGPLVMPLDDTYIHFQYARQMAEGRPFTYNTEDGPTSGATSLIYVPLLAAGYRIGFTGLSLAYWAIGIGIGCILLGGWLVYLSVRKRGGSRLISSLLMLTFAVNGAYIWSALSGMETALFVSCVLLCLYTYQKGELRSAVAAGVLVALVRPEGAFVAVTLSAALAWRSWQTCHKLSFWYVLPVLACGLQPLLNYTLTGTFAATGTLAKSEFYDVTASLAVRLGRVWDSWVRMWREFLEGRAAYGDPYIPGLVILLALVMVVVGARNSWQDRVVHPALLAGTWMLLLSASIATLETAFWHYKRYQLPIMALALPLAGWMLTDLAKLHRFRCASAVLAGVALVLSMPTSLTFLALYKSNVAVTTNFQYAMAQWIDTNVPADARVGVFDVGIVRYVGRRATYDVVGLTTPHVAGAMRQGPGAVYDTMAGNPRRPDYFALYPTPRHPTTMYLMRTRAWGQELARFEAPDLPNTTAPGNLQVITRADWSDVEPAAHVRQETTLRHLEAFRQIGMLNVGDLVNEQVYNYTWKNQATVPGFLTSVDRLPYYACAEEPCDVTDGTRAIHGEERFDLPAIESDEDYLVVLRANAAQSAHIEFGCGQTLGTRVVPSIPGYWVELVFQIPGNTRTFCIQTKDTYFAARYWIYAGHRELLQPETPSLAVWDNLSLLDYEIRISEEALALDTTWWVKGGLKGDGRLFVHLYTDPYRAPIAQWDGYLGKAQPLANLLPGAYEEHIRISLDNVPPGQYMLGLGFYDTSTGRRYAVQAENTDVEAQRIFLESVTIR